jgi:N-acetylglutamate synthase-like GNAT family acetyltransferase
MNKAVEKSCPRTVALSDGEIQLRHMTRGDEVSVLEFARALPAHDLLFMRRNITEPKVVEAWANEAAGNNLTTLLAVRGDNIVGCVAIVRDDLSWSPHVGELRLVVASQMRGKGLGRALTQESIALALRLGVEKLMALMTVDQHVAIGIFEGLGFQAEAVLRGHVKDLQGAKHDVVVLSLEITKYLERMQTYGDMARHTNESR